MPAGRLWQRLRRQLPATMMPAGWRRWPRVWCAQRLCLQLSRPWQPQAGDADAGWQRQGRHWRRMAAGWCWWLSADGCRLYVCRQR